MPIATMPASTVLVRPLDAAESISLFGNVARPAITGDDSDGALSILLYVAAPNGGPPPHRHLDQDETFITVDDDFEFLAGDAWVQVPALTVVHVPAGALHSFRNTAETPRRCWVLMRPGNQELFFRDLQAVEQDAIAEGTAPDMARVAAIYARYRMTVEP